MRKGGIKDEEIFARDGFRCVYCGFDGREFEGWAFLQVDHFKPRSLGGKDELENLVTSCVICNVMKGAQTWPTIADASSELRQYWNQMRKYWEENVRHLVEKQSGLGSGVTS
jgi:5-methylcytosine-specific restriction endonuclease McrA